MDAYLVVMVLFAALLHASWNALVKVGGEGILTVFLFKVGAVPFAAVVLMLTGFPNMACLPYAVASGLTFLVYAILLGHAYQNADFSLVYTIARGFAPIGVAVLASVYVGETLQGSMIVGIILVSVGIIFLTYIPRTQKTALMGLLSAAGVGTTITAYTLFDGIGARVSEDTVAYMALMNLISFLPICAFVLVRNRRAAMATVVKEWQRGVIGGGLMFIGYGIVIFAMAHAPMGAVSALRETSVIFAALIGSCLLKEPFGQRQFVATCVVAAGIMLIVLSRA